MCHLNESLISRCTLYNCVYCIIQIIHKQYRTVIGILYATDQSLWTRFHHCNWIEIFCDIQFLRFLWTHKIPQKLDNRRKYPLYGIYNTQRIKLYARILYKILSWLQKCQNEVNFYSWLTLHNVVSDLFSSYSAISNICPSNMKPFLHSPIKIISSVYNCPSHSRQ